MGSDDQVFSPSSVSESFQSTLPAWGATAPSCMDATHVIFQSTLPAWGATSAFHLNITIDDISIHAPRMGSDSKTSITEANIIYFNPRSPHGERLPVNVIFPPTLVFQSTLPAWGATLRILANRRFLIFQSTLPAWGATRWRRLSGETTPFQSTLPAWGATQTKILLTHQKTISIHAPRMGSDTINRLYHSQIIHFNPRSPHGERQQKHEISSLFL